MASDDEFRPRLGKARAQGGKRSRAYLHRVLAATNLARGAAASGNTKRSFSGSRNGRGSGIGRVLASRDHFAAYRQRRVIIKSRIVRLAGKGAAGAAAHLRYVQRDGVTRDGQPGALYGADKDHADGKAFIERATGDRHQFRFIVSAEDGAEYDDLKPLTRRLVAQMEQDLGTRLDWVAVDHFNTGHPHTHILVRGRDDRGQDLLIARDYITTGMRERACELVDLDLGPRDERAIEQRLRAEVEQERLTSIDRHLIRDADGAYVVQSRGRTALDQSLRAGRLSKLVSLGLAEPLGTGLYRLSPEIADTLTKLGERGDIIRTMQRAFAGRSQAPALADQAIYDPTAKGAHPLVGRLIERGLADELHDRHYVLVEATDGRTHYVAIGKGEMAEPISLGGIVRIDPVEIFVRDVDRTVAAVAAANGGRYTIDAHLRQDRAATEAFAETHVRRLEAIRRRTGGVSREPDGSWTIKPDHLERAAAFEAARASDRPVRIMTLSSQPLEQLPTAHGATWLDRELVATTPEALRDAGFGKEARLALERRRQWLIAGGFADAAETGTVFRPTMIRDLQRHDVIRAGAQLARDIGLPFSETSNGEQISGKLRSSVTLSSGRFAVIERSRDFTLVPWRPALEQQVGHSVSGIMREGGVSWSFGRQRSGPTIS